MGHQCCICSDEFGKSAFSYVFKNSEAMAIKNSIFFLIKQETAKIFSTLNLFWSVSQQLFFSEFNNIIFISD